MATASRSPVLPAIRPLCILPVQQKWMGDNDLQLPILKGDHILYLINDNEDYRPIYRSALVKSVSHQKSTISVIVYTPEGVQLLVRDFSQFKSLQKVEYTCIGDKALDITARETAIENAMLRLGERHYHCLFNNSHHFVTRAKTGLEYSLADLIHAIQEPRDSDRKLRPILTKSPIVNIEDIKPGDHIMDDSNHHWLAKTVNVDASEYNGWSCRGNTVEMTTVTISKQPEKDRLFKINYPQCSMETSTVLRNADAELEKKSHWEGSDNFVTKMKWGKSFSISKACLLDSSCIEPVSSTKVTPHVVLDRGDHLIVKVNGGPFRSVLIEAIPDDNVVVCMPGVDSNDIHGEFNLSDKNSQSFRVNYTQHLPPEEILVRANSTEGQRMLRSCLNDTSLFVSWAVTGRSRSINAEEITKNQQIKVEVPMTYKRINSENYDEIQPGDHLFVDYPYRYRWHFMVTKVCAQRNVFRAVYSLRGVVEEKEETIDPEKSNLYKVIYGDAFSPEVAIDRARSKVGERNASMWARLEFVRWAKTGSEEGVEVDFMTNLSVPSSKSSIVCFSQLCPGDYLVVEEHRLKAFHHCLVTEVTSPECCSVIEVWNRKVREHTFDLQPNNPAVKYYRLNYSNTSGSAVSRVCIPVQESISLGRKLKKTSFLSWYCRQTLINYLKTGEDIHKVDVNSLQDDRILLHREKVLSAMDLKKGDHIERPLKRVGKMTGCCHHMLVLQPIDDKKCVVMQCDKGRSARTGSAVRIEVCDIFECQEVSRVKYTERIDPDKGIEQLYKLAENVSLTPSEALRRVYCVTSNNCEHVVMLGTIGDAISIQVSHDLRKFLHTNVHRIIAMSPALGEACVRATSKGAAKTVAKVTGTALIRGAAKAAAKSGPGAAFQGAADAAEATMNSALASSFRIGYTAALSGTTVGLVGGIALGANILIESPLLIRQIYKVHRKKKFGLISSKEANEQYTIKTITSANTVLGGVGGALVGQVAIPVPVLGAAIGGFVGVLAGRACGYLEGRAAAAVLDRFSDCKETDLPVIAHCVYFPQ